MTKRGCLRWAVAPIVLYLLANIPFIFVDQDYHYGDKSKLDNLMFAATIKKAAKNSAFLTDFIATRSEDRIYSDLVEMYPNCCISINSSLRTDPAYTRKGGVSANRKLHVFIDTFFGWQSYTIIINIPQKGININYHCGVDGLCFSQKG